MGTVFYGPLCTYMLHISDEDCFTSTDVQDSSQCIADAATLDELQQSLSVSRKDTIHDRSSVSRSEDIDGLLLCTCFVCCHNVSATLAFSSMTLLFSARVG